MAAKKNTTLSIQEKLKVIAEVNEKNKNEVCEKYGCSKTTLYRILNNKKTIFEQAKVRKLSTKRNRTGACKEVERALLLWFNQIRAAGDSVTGNMVSEKARQFAIELQQNFKPTAGWLYRWQRREGILLRKSPGEFGLTVDVERTNYYQNTILPDLISSYDPSNIFNADESGLFFRALPASALNKNELNDLNSLREHLTLLFICNATGDYKKVIIIGKSKDPRCFKTPLKYYSQHKACMTQEIWGTFLNALDEEMKYKNRKVILFVNNAASHQFTTPLTNINLQYLPANCPKVQPLGQGIIHCFKSYYRQNLIRKQISYIENGKTIDDFIKSISIFNALHTIKHSWWLVKPQFIAYRFKKANFISGREVCQQEDNTQENILVNMVSDNDLQSEFQNYVRCDDNLICHEALTDGRIIQEVSHKLSSKSSDEEVESVDNTFSSSECFDAINTLRKYFLADKKFVRELESMESYIFGRLQQKPTKLEL